jgi:uncharacterized lipoprotein NlpE involved in copper resistance
MKKLFTLIFITVAVLGCNNSADKPAKLADNRIVLRTDTINTVKLTDTMVIYQSTCRGCAYENSTSFAIEDSMNIIKLVDIVTTDNSPADMNGGSISKDLVLVPVKPGLTNIRLYKFWSEKRTAEDSARFDLYKIEVKQ